MKRYARLAVLVAAVLLDTGAAPKTIGWNMTVAETPEGGHRLGNPDAKVRLVEYVSYASASSLRFEREAEGQLRLAYVASGKVSFEVRNLIRHPLDLTLAMLAGCGPKEKFFLNHAALIRSQDRWADMVKRATPSQRWRWTQSDIPSRNRAIASDLDLYEVMEVRGYDRLTVDKCLADKAAAAGITAQSDAAQDDGIERVPAFSINGKLLDIATWAQLRPLLDESLT
ncbi:MAG: thioredoxin domain-containing protein [Novosphingobium sp.]